MVEQVVGLEFVTSGEREIVSSIARVDSAQKKLQATSNALAQAQKRNAGSEGAVIKAYLALERSGLSYSDVLSGLRQDSQMAQKSAQQYNNALLGVDKAHKSAKSSADVFRTAMKANETALEQQAAETKQAAAADAALAREKDRLIQKLNPLRSASMLYEKELRDINKATRLGAINDRQRQQSLDALNAEFQSFNTGAHGAAMANNRFGAQSQMAGRKTNQLGVLMQQTGYQVGDFAVQVQGGTNVLVALGQQATQLVGTFGMLSKSTRMIGVFAGLGILIPIVTGVGAAFMRMRESADEATKGITREVEELSQAIGSLNSIQETTADSFDANLNSVFGETAESVSNLLAAIKEVRFENAILPVQQAVEGVRISVDVAAIQMDRLMMLSRQSPRDRRRVFGVSDRDLENIKASVRANIDLVNAQDEVRASLEAIADSRSSKELINNFASALTLVESIGGPAADDLQNALIEAAKEAGVYEEIIRQAGSATEDTADATEDAARSASSLADQMERAARAAMSFLNSVKSSTDLTGLQAEVAALERGLTPNQAAAEGVRAERRADPAYQAIVAGGSTPEIAQADALIEAEARRLQQEAELNARRQDLLRTEFTPTSPSGGGASNVVDINAILDSRRQQIEQERVLLGLSGQQREAQAIYFDLLKQNEEAVNSLTESELMGAANVLAAAQEKNRVIEEGLKRQQDISNLLESSMERAFMSIVDGTATVKDAFKAMASEIIKELYRVLVVKQLVGSVDDGTGLAGVIGSFFADGAAFSNGNVVPFADGGVVGSPTTFPMAGDKTGLMGEAGPEAIMPLKRGKDGKLGVAADGGGAVTVNNYFTVQANGDDSVKRIVRQQIPQIAEATKAAVVDAKRRGGSYGKAFG